MNERILRVLEYEKIKQQLSSHTETTLGNTLVSELKPATELKIVKQKQLETDEAAQITRLNYVIPLGGIYDIRPSLKRSELGGVLNVEECLNIANTIYGGRQAKLFFENLEEPSPILKGLAERITGLRELELSIKKCIDENGQVVDTASEKLRSIRSSIRTFEQRVRERLSNYTRTKSKLLSNDIITIRNDRYVLPVKHEYRSSIGGIVHDQSASGQTLFMEPKAVVELNNQLQEATAKEAQEIERILRELSEQIANHKTYLHENVLVLGEIDFIYARAKLGREMKAAMPKLNDQGFIKMKQARHPFIPEDEVVANDIEIGTDYTTIVITGPNTGGKTVVLKMVGLCTLMAQSGLQIPALDGCEIAVFDEVFADIGDEQSIEQSLSTFSSHMTNIVDIMKQVNHRSLVLFDELGAGTDPQEGAALAMSILDEVIARDARVIATTHYPELKAYGYNRENVINASVEFNVETLKPTYRLLIGIPGRSNAFEISQRLGLSDAIIQKAKSHIGVDSKSVETMIMSLEDSQKRAEADYEEAHQVLLDTEKIHEEIKKEWQKLEQKRESIYKKAEEKAEKALKNAREEAAFIVSEIKEMKTQANFKEHEWIDAQKMLEEATPNLSSKKQPQGTNTVKENQEIKKDDEVKVLTLNQTGTVIEKISNKEFLVQIGMMRVNVKRTNLQLMDKKKEIKEEPVAMVRGKSFHVGTELDLRGKRYDEALSILDKYIDDALLAGHSRVSIIHGKGTGALRKGVQEFAKSHPSIASCNPGKQSEGGDGISIIEFN